MKLFQKSEEKMVTLLIFDAFKIGAFRSSAIFS